MSHYLYTEKRRFSRWEAFENLILRANYEPTTALIGRKLITVGRGQILTTQKDLAKAWGWHRSTVSDFVSVLRTDMVLDIETHRGSDIGFTIITIRNYETYQGKPEDGSDIENDTPTDIRMAFEPTFEPTIKKEVKKKRRDSDYRDFVELWFGLFESHCGAKYCFAKKDGALIKRLLQRYEIEQLKDLARRFFESKDDWISKAGFTIGVFSSQVNKLLSALKLKDYEQGMFSPL